VTIYKIYYIYDDYDELGNITPHDREYLCLQKYLHFYFVFVKLNWILPSIYDIVFTFINIHILINLYFRNIYTLSHVLETTDEVRIGEQIY
jgi:hypothetical protein